MASDFQKEHVKELRKWIEGKLNTVITVTDVCNRSGYSHWHLQQLFREETGHSINEYIKFRRLYKCVLLLRLSDTPIMAIARHYQFGGANTFSRLFKKIFGVTPSAFRENAGLNLNVLGPSLNIINSNAPAPEIKYVSFDGIPLYGTSGSWQIPAEELDQPALYLKREIEAEFAHRTGGLQDEVFTQLLYQPCMSFSGKLSAEYHVGITDLPGVTDKLVKLPPLIGDYLMFTCRDIQCPTFEFASKVYWDTVFGKNITLRRGYEIERFNYTTHYNDGRRDKFDYHFLLPIEFDKHIHELLTK